MTILILTPTAGFKNGILDPHHTNWLFIHRYDCMFTYLYAVDNNGTYEVYNI